MVGSVEPGGSKVRDHFFLVSLTLPVGVLGHLLPSGFERVFHSIYVFGKYCGSLLKGRSSLWDNHT